MFLAGDTWSRRGRAGAAAAGADGAFRPGGAAPRGDLRAGGLQQAAMQIGGSLGTAVLGAVMASKVDSDL
ncbi:hypothetical protein ABT330_18805, partial [Streptomyces sp. NPDC000658]|uniref:hypothetical protein n=1 Tax=Streptomyces sp. NPDC000658 TaxID=3154266 RepID=UPI00331E169C